MHAYKFESTVQKDGTLKLSGLNDLENHKVEIIIIDEGKSERIPGEKRLKVKAFLDKWAGFLGEETDEDLKLDYLENKHK